MVRSYPYKPEVCGNCRKETWCEIRSNGKPQCRGCKVVKFFSNVLYPPLGYKLLDWQREVLQDIYGNVDPATGVRRYRSAYVSVAKKNGKSFLIGGLPIYHLLMENELNPEAYGAAAAKDQAGLVFKAAARLVEANPDLKAELKVVPSTKRIVRRDGGGFYAVISADGDLQDGIEPSLAMRDEVHRWKTQRAETLRDVIVKGQISRNEPLDIGITTAGAEYESPMWWREYQHAKRVIDGSVQSESFYAKIWEADQKRVESDPEYWKSLEARKAANPSHEALGGFLKDSAIAMEMQKAIDEPSERPKYLRYHLNIPLKAQEDPIIDMAKWQLSGGDVDLRRWPEYDVDLLIQKWGLLERMCWIGVDASWTTDLTALAFIFPPDGEEPWRFMLFFYVAQGQVPGLERICRVPLSTWVKQGFITATPGTSIDLRPVLDRIRWGREMFDLQEVPYDRLNFRTEALNLVDDGIKAMEVQQGFMQLSYPTKFLLAAYGDRKIAHGNNPVLNWMASCLQLQYDHKDNCQPDKPERGKTSKRIDGMQAIITGLSRALVFTGGGPSVYESRGLLSL